MVVTSLLLILKISAAAITIIHFVPKTNRINQESLLSQGRTNQPLTFAFVGVITNEPQRLQVITNATE